VRITEESVVCIGEVSRNLHHHGSCG